MENKFSKIIYFATPYALVCSLLYLLGYWTTFDLNILEFISISDIIRLSIYPICVSVLLSITSFIIGASYSARSSKPADKHTKWVAYVVLIIIVLLAQYRGYPMWMILVGLLLTEIIYNILKKFNLFENLIPNKSVRTIFLWVLIGIPILSFSYGKFDSNLAFYGKGVRYVDVSLFKNQEPFKNQKYVKYIGLKGDYLFFLSMDNTKIYISKTSEVPILELQKTIPKEKKKSK